MEFERTIFNLAIRCAFSGDCELFAKNAAFPSFPFPIIQLKDTRFEFYSTFKLFTGLASAALIVWKLTVIRVIRMAENPANTNTHQLILIR
jgi:hypothetical protein